MQRTVPPAGEPPPLRLPSMGHYARVTAVVVLVLAAFSAAWSVRNILMLVLVAAVLALGLDPAVRRLEGWHFSRGWAVTAIFLSLIGFLVLFAFLVIPPLVREVSQLANHIPDYVNRLKNSNGWIGNLERKYHLSTRLTELVATLPAKVSSSLGRILGLTKSIASVIFNLLTVAILTIYFLLAMPKLHRSALTAIQTDEGDRAFEEALQFLFSLLKTLGKFAR